MDRLHVVSKEHGQKYASSKNMIQTIWSKGSVAASITIVSGDRNVFLCGEWLAAESLKL